MTNGRTRGIVYSEATRDSRYILCGGCPKRLPRHLRSTVSRLLGMSRRKTAHFFCGLNEKVKGGFKAALRPKSRQNWEFSE